MDILELLKKKNVITDEQINSVKNYQKMSKVSLTEAIVKQEILAEPALMDFLSKELHIPFIDLSNCEIPEEILKKIHYEFIKKNNCIPVKRRGRILSVAMVDPLNIACIEDMKFMTGHEIEPLLCAETALKKAIDKYYGTGVGIEDIMEEMQEEELEIIEEEKEEVDVTALSAAVEDAPVVRYVASLIADSARKGASDIHIEPYENMIRVRSRIDGTLYEMPAPPLKLKNAVISRVKVMANLDLAERRVPQDGRIKMKLSDRAIDLRVSTLPTLYGEKVVMRILDKSALALDLEKLGFEKQALKHFLKAIEAPYGLVLVTGPTGSGKTTTLYSALLRINRPETNIMTAEDPVEYNFPGINQVQVREEVKLTFAESLRSFLRQDPDIIMVGEIRDNETATIAIRAALTGHLVLSTLHTNDAPSSVARFIDMDIEPFYVTSAVNLILAQRLVKCICNKCKEKINITPQQFTEAGIDQTEVKDSTFYKGKGCPECRNSGYKGRAGIYEVMPISPGIKEMILKEKSVDELRAQAVEEGMVTLREGAILKFKRGLITLEEVVRVTSTI